MPAVPAAAPLPVPVVTQAMAATARLPLKSPLGAALLSWLWPGLGSCYAGRIGCGLAQAIFIPVVYFALLLIAAFTVDPLPLIVTTRDRASSGPRRGERRARGKRREGERAGYGAGSTGRRLCAIAIRITTAGRFTSAATASPLQVPPGAATVCEYAARQCGDKLTAHVAADYRHRRKRARGGGDDLEFIRIDPNRRGALRGGGAVGSRTARRVGAAMARGATGLRCRALVLQFAEPGRHHRS